MKYINDMAYYRRYMTRTQNASCRQAAKSLWQKSYKMAVKRRLNNVYGKYPASAYGEFR